MPGQELREITVRRPIVRETDSGRVTANGETEALGTVRAVLAAAKPEEIERWRQLGHPVTHKIIMRYTPPFDIRPGDIFEMTALPGRTARRFYNQAIPYNVGDIGHWTIFYCDERTDVS
jgi:hypothetical protein